ncbi:MAG: universal stress protein [Spirochaetia bacterium]|nr:universal stress protein [Spirochaetia bacterium]
MAEKILVPLDGSALGEAALDYVRDFIQGLSPETQVTVVLMHVITTLTHQLDVHSGGVGTVIIPYTDEETENMKKDSRLYLARVSKKFSDLKVEVKTHVVQGDNPAEEIVKAEEELSCDLVAMSTHGRSGLSRWAFGSVTDKVLRAGSVPVLMVRAHRT